ncbi:MAG TPA: hypothetical protein VGX71_01510 [Pseudaminobacter sp.]|nr:hypothetical protein [Pseudaminobacter sp.]
MSVSNGRRKGRFFLRGQTVKAGRGDEEVCVRAGCAFVLYPVSQNGVLLPAAGAPFTGARGRSGGFGEGPAKPETGGGKGTGIQRSPVAITDQSHDEVGAGEQDLHVGRGIAIHIGVDDLGAAVVRIAKLAGDGGERGAADEREGLVPSTSALASMVRKIDAV